MKQNESIERELRLAKEYWLQTVQPRIAGRKLRDVELFVAKDAYLHLYGAQRRAEDWNCTQEGRLSPLDVDLSGEKFRKPEVSFADKDLKPQILAEIAAPLMNKSKSKLTPAEAVRLAHELLMAAERYIGTLPEQKEGTESLVSDIELAFSTVTFTEIEASNGKDSGQLPLLPPVQQGRNEGKLSLTALRKAVKDFYEQEKNNRPQITEEQFNHAAEQDARLAQEGRLIMIGSGKRTTYQEWQRQPDEAITDCLQNNRLSWDTLCTMRWERFKRLYDKQQLQASTRKPPKPKKSETKPPKSAATSPQTAGKREK
jgi:hypothetical protein